MAEAAHVRAGGSVIHRIIACPGSLAAPNSGTNAAAERGTLAHTVVEKCLRLGSPAKSFLNWPMDGLVVDMAIVDSAQVCVDWANGIMATAPKDAVMLLEQRVTWEAFGPPEEMRGSADVIIVIPSMGLLIVGDFKNGVDPVPVVGNMQLRYYAAAALATLPREQTKHVRKVQLTIIQPNALPMPQTGPVCSETIDVGELIDFADAAMTAVRRGQEPDAERAPGHHCKYCGFKADCAVRAEQSVAQAQSEFAVVETNAALSALSVETLAGMALQAEKLQSRLSAWLKDAKARIETELKQGTPVPGWKLVPKRAERVWNDPEALKAWATLDAGLAPADIYSEPTLKSPAQVEALVGKKTLPSTLYSKISSGYNLATDASDKPAVVLPSAGDEFQAISE